MAHPTRGFTSHTYDITAVHDVDYDELTITFSDASRYERQTIAFGVERTPAAVQVWQSVAESISVYGTGQWESLHTLSKMVPVLRRLVLSLHERGVDDLSDPDLLLKVLRAAIEDFDVNYRRTVNKLIGRTLKLVHPGGVALARALSNTRYVTMESTTELYEDAEADAIEQASRGLFAAVFAHQRDIFKVLGYDTSGRSWLSIPAEEVVAAARKRHPQLVGAVQPSSRRPMLEQVDWALLNPTHFGLNERRNLLGQSMQDIANCLYPQKEVLTAAAILQCFAEQTGMNLSVILRTHVNDLQVTGDDTAMLFTAKARNHSEERVPVLTEHIFAAGGLHQALSGLTRFARLYRREHLASNGEVPEIADRLYVEHRSEATKAKVVEGNSLQSAWRSKAFDPFWEANDLDRQSVGLRFNALRRKVLERIVSFDPSGDVHGHSERTRVSYLANVLPDHTLAKHAVAAQDAIIDGALQRFVPVSESDDPRAQVLSSQSEQVVDVVVASCANGGNDPDDSDRPCSLGPAACFTCPNGYRTVDNVPGLLAAVQLSEIIRDHDPDEWENGEAASIHYYATETLKQFPQPVVERIRCSTDLTPHIVNMTSVYTELRR